MEHLKSDIAKPTEYGLKVQEDEAQLRAMGYKEEMPRQFSRLAALSFAFGITNSWVGQTATFRYPLLCGGGPGVFFSVILAGLACWFITAGLAELASAFPTTGGQYHYAYYVANPKTRVFTAFVTGWVSVLAWCLLTASSAVFAAQMIASLVSVYHDDYASTRWQVYLVYIAIMLLVTAIVCLLPRQLPLIEKILFFASLMAFVVFFITVLAMSKQKSSSTQVFTQWRNQTGWPDGFAFMLATGTGMYVYIGTDSVIHLAEEIPRPSKNVPQVMNMTMGMGLFTALLWTLAFLFSATDYDDILTSEQPLMAIFEQSLGNQSVATFYTCWFLFIYVGCALSNLATVGRLAWALARDNGLPASKFLSQIHPSLRMPVNATIAGAFFVTVYGAIYCGSTEAFNSFLNAAILFINMSYAIPQGIVVWRGRDKILPERYMNLGRFGAFCNVFSVVWVAFFIILFCFPTISTTTAQNMNYVSVVTVGCFAIITAVWFSGKNRSFSGPLVHPTFVLDGVTNADPAKDIPEYIENSTAK